MTILQLNNLHREKPGSFLCNMSVHYCVFVIVNHVLALCLVLCCCVKNNKKIFVLKMWCETKNYSKVL
jgi:hypothetical protein